MALDISQDWLIYNYVKFSDNNSSIMICIGLSFANPHLNDDAEPNIVFSDETTGYWVLWLPDYLMGAAL